MGDDDFDDEFTTPTRAFIVANVENTHPVAILANLVFEIHEHARSFDRVHRELAGFAEAIDKLRLAVAANPHAIDHQGWGQTADQVDAAAVTMTSAVAAARGAAVTLVTAAAGIRDGSGK